MNKNISTQDWGLVAYQEAWDRQEELFNAALNCKRNAQTTENILVLCEHPHVYTLGKSGNEDNLLLNYIQLKAQHATFVSTNRGGDITYHGPGQIVGYPIFDLANFGMGLKTYIHTIEEVIIDLLQYFGIKAERLQGAAGVWLDVKNPRLCRKICAIGVRSSNYVTMHGFALNVNTDLNYFKYINPCGFQDKGVTSMQIELGKKVDVGEVKNLLVKYVAKQFSTDV
jgi:lipoyl(octanoyl) transferase